MPKLKMNFMAGLCAKIMGLGNRTISLYTYKRCVCILIYIYACVSYIRKYIWYIWMFPKIRVPQNGWFMMENPINRMIWGYHWYHYFWKHPCREITSSSFSHHRSNPPGSTAHGTTSLRPGANLFATGDGWLPASKELPRMSCFFFP